MRALYISVIVMAVFVACQAQDDNRIYAYWQRAHHASQGDLHGAVSGLELEAKTCSGAESSSRRSEFSAEQY
jgi:formaldehyde-activating enzyme involved in methanogenesis